MRSGLLSVIARELISVRTLRREAEPDLVMDDAAQVAAYAEAGRIDGIMAAAYLFHTARASLVIQGCERVIDIGCGPATQLCQIAELNPGTRFLGVDLSPEMLSAARTHAARLGLRNVEFEQGDMTDLSQVGTGSMAGLISTMALHHLPTIEHLRKCFGEMRRVLRPGGALYVTDFGGLKSLKSVRYFAHLNAERQPAMFTLDYERSLKAAFLPSEFRRLSASELGADYRVLAAFPVPVLTVVKSEDRPSVASGVADRVRRMREQLEPGYRRDLDTLRRLFALAGMRHDPFR